MKVLYVGNPVDLKVYEKLSNTRFISYADNYMQIKFLFEVYKHFQNDFEVITINTENPKAKKIDFIDKKIKTTFIKYNNKNSCFFYFGLMIRNINEIFKYLKKNRGEKIVVITNGPYIYYSLPVILAKIFYKFKYICYLVCTVELPQYKGIYGLVQSMSKHLIKRSDATITYVEKSSIDYTNKPYLCINFQIDREKINISNKCLKNKTNKITDKINIVYTGALTKIYGIEKLLCIIDELPDNFCLTICGDGECKKEVLDYEKKKPKKLQYLGLLPNKEVINLQAKSDILISLKLESYFTEYANSSKITEYFLSNKPVIVNEHGALNKEMKEYLNIAKKTDTKYLVNYILELSKKLHSKEIRNKCIFGREYVINNCIEGVQSNKICEFIEKIGD